MTRHVWTIPDLTLERYRLAELSEDDTAEVSRRAPLDPAVRGRLDALAQSDVAIRGEYPADWLARAVAERASRAP